MDVAVAVDVQHSLATRVKPHGVMRDRVRFPWDLKTVRAAIDLSAIAAVEERRAFQALAQARNFFVIGNVRGWTDVARAQMLDKLREQIGLHVAERLSGDIRLFVTHEASIGRRCAMRMAL